MDDAPALDLPLDDRPLDKREFALLAVVFLRQAIALIDAKPGDRGLPLSLVNSAFNALLHSVDESGPELAGKLNRLSEAVMSEITS